MSGDMSTARAPRECPVCAAPDKREQSRAHVAKHDDAASSNGASANGNGAGRPRGPLSKAQQGKQAATRAVGRYLDVLAEQSEYGTTSGVVRLGALPGFPAATTDPDVIDAAADQIAATADAATSRVRELQYRQRVMTLRELALELRRVRPKTQRPVSSSTPQNGQPSAGSVTPRFGKWAYRRGCSRLQECSSGRARARVFHLRRLPSLHRAERSGTERRPL